MQPQSIFNEEDKWFEDANLCRLQYMIGDKIVSVLSIKDCPEHETVDAHTEKVVDAYETDLDYVGIVCLCYPPELTQGLRLQ